MLFADAHSYAIIHAALFPRCLHTIIQISFPPFTTLVFSLLTKKASRMMSRVETFGEEIGVNPTALQGLIRSWMTFLRTAQKNNMGPKAVMEEIVSIGLAEDKAKYIAKLYKKNLVALSRAVVGRTLTVNHLTDMEWRFGVVSGSSEARSQANELLHAEYPRTLMEHRVWHPLSPQREACRNSTGFASPCTRERQRGACSGFHLPLTCPAYQHNVNDVIRCGKLGQRSYR